MQNLAVYLLGSPKIEVNGVEVVLPTAKSLGLVAYLIISGSSLGRERLAPLLWPELDIRRGMAALRTTVWRVNKAIPGLLDAQRSSLSISDPKQVWVDSQKFSDLINSVRTHKHHPGGFDSFIYPGAIKKEKVACSNCLPVLEEAVSLYHGDFMAGFQSINSQPFEQWQLSVASWYYVYLLDALERLIAGYAALGRLEAAIPYALIQYQTNKYSESSLRQLLWLYLLSGNRRAAQKLYREFEELNQETGSYKPEPETLEILKKISAFTPKPEPISKVSEFSPGITTVEPPLWRTARMLNLPAELTPFIGREKELQEIEKLLVSPDCRLLTLLGPGGVGKTRLALQAAYRMTENAGKTIFPDGIFFIPFSGARDPQTVTQTLAKVFNFSFYGQEHPINQFTHFLQNKKMLLIPDNIEQLTVGLDHILGALESAQNLKFLTTSRERLNLRGEWTLLVRGLSYPKNNAHFSTDQYDAVSLFLKCARRVNPEFTLKEDEKPYIRKLCQLLDGMPLGIEMAAAWTRSLSIENIVREIENDLDFLVASHVDFPQRQKSLRASFDYSWQLLSKAEQNILKKLSIFRGGFSRETASLIAEVSLRTLSVFIDKSIIHLDGPERYKMIELFRRYVEEKLDQEPSTRRKLYDDHCREFANFLNARKEALHGPRQETALKEIYEEIDNIRGAWNWAVEQSRVDELDKMVEALSSFYNIRGWYREAYEVFSSAVDAIDDPSLPLNHFPTGKVQLLTTLLCRKGRYEVRLGDYQHARESLGHGMTLAIYFNLQDRLAYCLQILGTLERALGAFQEARRLFRESLEIFRRLNYEWSTGFCLLSCGSVAESHQEAKVLYQEAVEIFERIGDQRMYAGSIINISDACLNLGEYQQARKLASKSLEISQRLEARHHIVCSLMNMGESEVMLEKYTAAKEHFQLCLGLYAELCNSSQIALCEKYLGICEMKLRNTSEAHQYFLSALERAIHIPNSPEMLDILVSIAIFYVELRNYESALEIARVVVNYDSAWKKTLLSANEVIRDCAADTMSIAETEFPKNVEELSQQLYKSMKLDLLIQL
ncbi:MAG: hypothetical protein EHM41_11070 [Chloroflexi bacterium]|nr:MAG: hypothetical protein EHM41_11070 [Chloroflexota bacterium]